MENTIENGNASLPNNDIPMKSDTKMKRTRQRLIFYILVMLFPMVHFLVFKIYINLDMFAMAFSEYVKPEGQVVLVREFVGLKNFNFIIETFQSVTEHGRAYSWMLRNSFIYYLIGLSFVPVGIFFAYYIYKGYPFGNFFRVMLYLPQILSAVVLTFLYKEIMRTVLQTGGLQLGHIILYNFWTGFGVNVIMYTGAMCGINSSISESAQLDGASAFRELWSITLPMIFPTIVTFLVMGIAGIFTNQANMFSFYSSRLSTLNPDAIAFQPLGYYMYVQTMSSGPVVPTEPNAFTGYGMMSFPQLSMLGLMITIVVLPIALGLRHVLEKYGPSDK